MYETLVGKSKEYFKYTIVHQKHLAGTHFPTLVLFETHCGKWCLIISSLILSVTNNSKWMFFIQIKMGLVMTNNLSFGSKENHIDDNKESFEFSKCYGIKLLELSFWRVKFTKLYESACFNNN